VAWGLWEQPTGITGNRAGAGGLRTEVALRLLDAAMSGDVPVVVAAAEDPRTRIGREPSSDRSGPAAVNALAQLPAARRGRALLDLVQNRVAKTLGLVRPADPGRAFTDLGFTSLTALELRNSIAEETGLPLPASLVFDHPNARALAGYLDTRVAPEAGPGPAADPMIAVAALEEALAGTGPDDPRAAAAVERIRVLLEGRNGTPTDDGTAAALGTASADDLLAFIDQEFGKPRS